MSSVTYFPRYTTAENVVTNTTLHLFSQINQHSADTFRAVLGEIVGVMLKCRWGINFRQQTRSPQSVPDGSILQERVHVLIETKVTASTDIDQLIRHCESFDKGKNGKLFTPFDQGQGGQKNP